jgi:hypothetical protein
LSDSEIKEYSDFILAHGKGLGSFEWFLKKSDCRVFLTVKETEEFMNFIDELEGKDVDEELSSEFLERYKNLFPNDG